MIKSEIIGYVAGFLTTFSFIPQVLKSYKIMINNMHNVSKINSDISISFMVIICTGMCLWILYGVTLYLKTKGDNVKTHNGLSIILWNSISAFLALLVIVFTLRS